MVKGVRLSDIFYEKLKELDPKCDAILDPWYDDGDMPKGLIITSEGTKGAIIVWAHRQGKDVHELTIKRNAGESNTSLQQRAIFKMKNECDTWKKFAHCKNPGLAYDDYLDEQEQKARAARQRKIAEDKGVRIDKILTTDGDAVRKSMVALQK